MTDRYALLDADGNVCNIIQWDGVEAHEETETWIETVTLDDGSTEEVECSCTRVVGWSPPEGCKARPFEEGDVVATLPEPAEQTAVEAKADLAQRLATSKASTVEDLKRLLAEWAEGTD